MAMDLNDAQKKAAHHPEGPLLIVAGAGSGKTRTLTSRLVALLERGVEPRHIAAITFTNKAADEMRSRAAKALSPDAASTIFIGTFHSMGARILRREGHVFGRTNRFSIFDADDSLKLIKIIHKELDIPKEERTAFASKKDISKIKNELDDEMQLYDNYTVRVFNAYEEALQKNNAFDFDDLIEKVVRLFERHPKTLQKYQTYFQHILVDEFQDTNTSQYALLKLLAGKHRNISVVGDDAQSIYGFRNANVQNFLDFENDWPGTEVVTLDQNYRSTQTILDGASALIQNNAFQKQKHLWTDIDGGEPIVIARAKTQADEADFVADVIDELVTSHPHESIAVLYRTNAQSRAIETELIVRDIPYKIFGSVRFYDRQEVKDVVAALRIVLNPDDSISRGRIEKALTKKIAASAFDYLDSVSPDDSPVSIISGFIEHGSYLDRLAKKFKNAPERIENVNELIEFAGTFEKLDEFLERISLLQSTDVSKGASEKSPVSLMTIHMAKGLEFETVFVIGCKEGLLPHQFSYGTVSELEEERRLMYVAMTRAKKRLFLTFSNFPSRFLHEIPPELTIFTDRAYNKRRLPDEDEMYIDSY